MGRTLTPCKHRKFPLQLMGNKCPWLIHNVLWCHCMKMWMPALKNNSTYALLHLDIYCSYIQMRADVKVFSPTLCRPAKGWRDGDRPQSTLNYTGLNTTRIRPWLAKKFWFLLWSPRGECPISLAGVQSTGKWGWGGGGMQRALYYYPLLNFCWG